MERTATIPLEEYEELRSIKEKYETFKEEKDIDVVKKNYEEKINELITQNEEYWERIGELNDTLENFEQHYDSQEKWAIEQYNILKSKNKELVFYLEEELNYLIKKQSFAGNVKFRYVEEIFKYILNNLKD